MNGRGRQQHTSRALNHGPARRLPAVGRDATECAARERLSVCSGSGSHLAPPRTTFRIWRVRLPFVNPCRGLEAEAVSELQGIARFKFDEGKLEEFKRLSAQCMEIVRTKDTGTLQYEIYFNDDQSECIVLERSRTILRYALTDLPVEHSWRAELGGSAHVLPGFPRHSRLCRQTKQSEAEPGSAQRDESAGGRPRSWAKVPQPATPCRQPSALLCGIDSVLGTT